MANSRTTSLHEKLSPDLRAAVERDLVEQPPGRETYEKCYEFHDLGHYGVSLKALQRWGGYLRTLARNARIRAWGDELLSDVDLKKPIEGQIRGKLFELLVEDEMGAGELLKVAIAAKAVRDSEIKGEEWEMKKAEAAKALAKAESEGQHDPQKALANLTETVRTLYGLKMEPAKT